jgi:hypothetical protein
MNEITVWYFLYLIGAYECVFFLKYNLFDEKVRSKFYKSWKMISIDTNI